MNDLTLVFLTNRMWFAAEWKLH